ncbi:hypothetical protein BurJ1DRAFT_2366 [Burkholderiales bacterium JOSHI_001]|nr:hypothetical protein BurJ1DRAFT_2366 [Burkholderiales bacterium JOSHI_001]
MATPPRDRISVDLHGLKAELCERSQALGMQPSALVRTLLADALDRPAPVPAGLPHQRHGSGHADRVRVSLRMARAQAQALFEAAQRAGLSPGDHVAGLVAGVPVLTGSGRRADHLAALVASSAELSSFSRNINHLTSLLRQGAFRPAEEYRPMLNTLGADVRRHLALAAGVLADLRPHGVGPGHSRATGV